MPRPDALAKSQPATLVYKDNAGTPRDAQMTEGRANFSEMTRQARLSVQEAKDREARDAEAVKKKGRPVPEAV